MKTFLGKIDAKLDAKGRVFVPSVFRKVLSEEERERVVVRMEADEKYLLVYPESVWNRQVVELQSKLNEWDSDDQMLLMQFVGDAEVLEFDAQGRVLLPKRLQMTTTAMATMATHQLAAQLVTAEPARLRPMQMIMGPVTMGGKKRMTLVAP